MLDLNRDLESTKVAERHNEQDNEAEEVNLIVANTPRQRKRGSMQTRIIFALAAVAVLAAVPFVFKKFSEEKTDNGKKAAKDRAVPVTVARATIQDVPLSIRSIGNVLPFSVVNVIPQVGGQLKKVYFTQGQSVHKGDLLFQIDPSQYDASLKQALGNVARDRAQIMQAQATLEKDQAQVGALKANLIKDSAQNKYAEVELSRYDLLQKEGAVSKEQSDQTITNAATAQATTEADKKAIENAEAVVKGDQAAIETAKGTLEADQAAAQNVRIQLGWTQIRSPIDGRTGSLNVYEGNVVMANSQQPLVTIDQVQPIYVNFTVPEQYLDEVRKNLQLGKLKVEALVEGRRKNAVQGQVSFLENTVNTSTGTVVLRAAFANTEQKLYPGQFVDVVVSMPPDAKTVVVPAKAVQTTQQGSAVYILSKDNTVNFVPVEVVRTYGDIAALSKGVNVDDLVVTDGQLQLTPGAKVHVVQDASADDASTGSAMPGGVSASSQSGSPAAPGQATGDANTPSTSNPSNPTNPLPQTTTAADPATFSGHHHRH